jgi:hypothetical protein
MTNDENEAESRAVAPKAVYDYWQSTVAKDPRYNSEVQNLAILFLDGNCSITGYKIVTQGLRDKLLFGHKEVFQPLAATGCDKFAVAHNHPAGSVEPEDEDISATQAIVKGSEALGLEMKDSIIIGAGDKPWFSMREACLEQMARMNEIQKQIKEKLSEALGGKEGIHALADKARNGGGIDKEVVEKVKQVMSSILPGSVIIDDSKFFDESAQSGGLVQPPEPGQNLLPGTFGNVKIGNFKPPGSEHRN